MQITPPATSALPLSRTEAVAIRRAATELEASFFSEMLKPMGTDRPPDSFGGGAGEDQFSSFLRSEEARAMARHGGIGLAERLFPVIAGRGGAQNDI